MHGIKHLPISDEKVQQLKNESLKDQEFLMLNQTILNGWLNDRRRCHPHFKEYWNFREQEIHLYSKYVNKLF